MTVNDGGRTTGLTVTPLDTLFFRDGRPMGAGLQAASRMPMPQTMAGALRTWLLTEAGCDFYRLGHDIRAGRSFAEAAAAQGERSGAVAGLAFRGPWFAIDGEPCVPVPASLRTDEQAGRIIRLDPLPEPPPGWGAIGGGMQPLWHRDPGHASRIEGFVTFAGLKQFLAGDVPERAHIRAAGDLFDRDRRVGIGIDPDSFVAKEEMIYAVELLALKDRVTLYAEVFGPAAVVDALPETAIIALGGEGRRALITRADPVAWPSKPGASAGDQRLLLLTTPGLFDGGWKPSALAPLAAAVPDYVAVSGWDLARGGPKPNRFAAAAGSVFFFNQPLAAPATAGSLCAGDDAALGWGSYLEGTWSYA